MNPTPSPLPPHRVILAHYDSYSTALVFARHGGTLLWPEALPEDATPAPAPAGEDEAQWQAEGLAVRDAVAERYGFRADELVAMHDFQHWAQTPDGPVRIHLLRFDTFEAPKAAVEPHGAVFKPISELRTARRDELLLLREVFNLIIGGGGRA